MRIYFYPEEREAMGCLCRDEQIVEVKGGRVVLKGVRETFRFVRLMRGRNAPADIGPVLVAALREVGNHIPVDEEEEYGSILAEMFAVYCVVDPEIGCR